MASAAGWKRFSLVTVTVPRYSNRCLPYSQTFHSEVELFIYIHRGQTAHVELPDLRYLSSCELGHGIFLSPRRPSLFGHILLVLRECSLGQVFGVTARRVVAGVESLLGCGDFSTRNENRNAVREVCNSIEVKDRVLSAILSGLPWPTLIWAALIHKGFEAFQVDC